MVDVVVVFFELEAKFVAVIGMTVFLYFIDAIYTVGVLWFCDKCEAMHVD